jgi:hypothetical protein
MTGFKTKTHRSAGISGSSGSWLDAPVSPATSVRWQHGSRGRLTSMADSPSRGRPGSAANIRSCRIELGRVDGGDPGLTAGCAESARRSSVASASLGLRLLIAMTWRQRPVVADVCGRVRVCVSCSRSPRTFVTGARGFAPQGRFSLSGPDVLLGGCGKH